MKTVKILESGSVVRYHATMIDKKQNVAEHSWEAAVILMQIYPEYTKDMMEHMLTHDCAERYTGDVCAPIKREHPEIKQAFDDMERRYLDKELGLTNHKFQEHELLAMKYADIMSGVYFCNRRQRAGDTEAKAILSTWIEYIDQLEYLNDECNTLLWSILR
jgi:5'-deoxynucleotidase YfbR-like HD superfamily hydrolase